MQQKVFCKVIKLISIEVISWVLRVFFHGNIENQALVLTAVPGMRNAFVQRRDTLEATGTLI